MSDIGTATETLAAMNALNDRLKADNEALRKELSALKSGGWTYVKDGLPVDESKLYDLLRHKTPTQDRIYYSKQIGQLPDVVRIDAWRIHREEVAPPLPTGENHE